MRVREKEMNKRSARGIGERNLRRREREEREREREREREKEKERRRRDYIEEIE